MASSIWFPYTQMKTSPDALSVHDAEGVFLYLDDGRCLVDAISSWWCMIHGYKPPEIIDEIKYQLDRLPHVMLGGLVHERAQKLADQLVEITPEGLNHVFFGDSGSVGVEIALKMALQYWKNQRSPLNPPLRKGGTLETVKTKFVSLKKAYHGDTCGAMSVCDPDDGMHALFSGWLPRQLFVSVPKGGLDASQEQIDEAILELESILQTHHETIAAMIVEPIVQGAGGMIFYSPEYLKLAKDCCDRYNILMIFDEVATGFGRTGKLFAAEHAGVSPDIMVLGKGLTAGFTGHSATLANDRVFEAFWSDDTEKCFMHGPTFMGNPLACTAALKSLECFKYNDVMEKIATIESTLKEHLLPFTSSKIKETRVLGAIGVMEVHDRSHLKGMTQFAVDRGVWLRPFENVAYTMPPYIIQENELMRIINVMKEWFQ